MSRVILVACTNVGRHIINVFFEKQIKSKLVGIIKSENKSYISMINQDGETVSLAMFEELNDGVKLVDMKQDEVIFQSDDLYLIMNFKNQIRETNEY